VIYLLHLKLSPRFLIAYSHAGGTSAKEQSIFHIACRVSSLRFARTSAGVIGLVIDPDTTTQLSPSQTVTSADEGDAKAMMAEVSKRRRIARTMPET